MALRGLRLYLKENPEGSLIKEIEGITEPPLLRALWEAGLRAPLQEAVMQQLDKLGGV